MPARKNIGKKKFISIEPVDIAHMKKVDLIPLLKQARVLYAKQAKIFEANEKVFSPAFEKMQSWYENHGEIKLSKIKASEARSEVASLQSFFKSKTSTVKGSKDVLEEQSRRIFGVDKRGRARFIMTPEQAKTYWALYSEYNLLASSGLVKAAGSDVVQSVVGEYLLEQGLRKKGGDAIYFDSGDIKAITKRLEKIMSLEDWPYDEAELDKVIHAGEGTNK